MLSGIPPSSYLLGMHYNVIGHLKRVKSYWIEVASKFALL